AQIIDWMVDEYSSITGDKTRASFTGKSIANGGSEGRDAATGQGGVYVLEQLLELNGRSDDKITIAVQGYGNVGSWFSTLASSNPNWTIIAVSDSSGALYKEQGLDSEELESIKNHKNSRGRVAECQVAGVKVLSNDELLALEVDVLVLAALGDAVTETNADAVRAALILELANGPVNENAHTSLESRGVNVVPDILANAGGVIVSYYEWYQNMHDETWTESVVNQKLEQQIKSAAEDIHAISMSTEGATLKDAAFIKALNSLT
ncbi:MAG: glutamate dehydrogenase, partial [Patescibacteria group bacterium]